MKEKYEHYRTKYDEHIILMKSGNFYIALNEDALILNKLFNYKVKEVNHYIRIGFPLLSLNKVLIKLIELNINYVVIDIIIEKQEFRKNKYFEYYINYDSINYRIDKINSTLRNNISNKNIDRILGNVEKIICKIN